LTEGTIWKQLVRYASPVILSSLLQSAYSIADFLIAGRLIGNAGLSAINNSSQLMLILTQIIMGIAMGASILMSQYYGSRDNKNRAHTNVTLFTFSMIMGAVMLIMVLLFGRGMLMILGAPAIEEASIYLSICALGIIPIFGYNALASMVRSVGNSKQPLYCIFVTSVLNVVLDILFMGPFKMGVAGAALATILSQMLSFAIMLIYVLSQKELFSLSLRHLYVKKDKFKQMLRLGIPCSIQMTVIGLSWLTMTFLINAYGVEASAASGICAKVRDCTQIFSLAMGNACATMIGQCLGAKKYDRASRVVHVGMRIAIGISIVLIIIIELTAPNLVALFQQDSVTSAIAVQNLRIEIVAAVFYASFLVYNALPMAAGHTGFSLFSSLVNCIFVRLILAIILNHIYGLVGVFVACMLAPASSVPLGYIYEKMGRWRKSLADE
ncbi:MAG: MATE family efflux transporter, partial [Clostridia bacterium]